MSPRSIDGWAASEVGKNAYRIHSHMGTENVLDKRATRLGSSALAPWEWDGQALDESSPGIPGREALATAPWDQTQHIPWAQKMAEEPWEHLLGLPCILEGQRATAGQAELRGHTHWGLNPGYLTSLSLSILTGKMGIITAALSREWEQR